jgi:hypothetical protein
MLDFASRLRGCPVQSGRAPGDRPDTWRHVLALAADDRSRSFHARARVSRTGDRSRAALPRVRVCVRRATAVGMPCLRKLPRRQTLRARRPKAPEFVFGQRRSSAVVVWRPVYLRRIGVPSTEEREAFHTHPDPRTPPSRARIGEPGVGGNSRGGDAATETWRRNSARGCFVAGRAGLCLADEPGGTLELRLGTVG